MAKFSLLLSLLLGVTVSASAVVIRDSIKPLLPFALKLVNLTKKLPELDRARAVHLMSRGKNANLKKDKCAGISVPVTNTAVAYTASVGIGNTKFNLLIDTGSSNTWVRASAGYPGTGTNTGLEVAVNYPAGEFLGTEWIDKVTLSSGLVVEKQSIGVASYSDLHGVDGVLGIGPVILTEGTLLEQPSTTIPTVTNNLFSQGTISTDLVGISYNPLTTEPVTNGELTFGGTDPTKFTGAITWTPVTGTEPASFYWGIDQSITYGTTKILSSTAGVVDTSSTLVLIATDGFNAYRRATDATTDFNNGLLKVTPANFNKLQNLNFVISGTTFTLTPNAQIWPRSLNSVIGGTTGSIYLIVADLGSPSGEGLDFINGYTFLERFYTVLDTTNHRVGFATTLNTRATTN